MTDILNQLALATQRAPGLRSYQLLGGHDWPRLDAFFQSFDFDQRRAYFGGGISDHSIRDFCRAIHWGSATIIARGGPYCIEAVAMLSALPPDQADAELSIACPLICDQRAIVAELVDIALEIAAAEYRSVIVRRELGHPDLLALLRDHELARFDCETVRLTLAHAEKFSPAA